MKHSPLLVAIVGGSGAGKSWLADKLHAALGRDAARLSLDDFYRDRSKLSPGQRARINFDHPRAIDWDGLTALLRGIATGRAVSAPSYDFKTHCRRAAGRMVHPKPVLLMDGLWLLRRPALRKLFALKIFIDCPARLRWRRRLARDVASRGRTRASIREQFRKMVEPMHGRFVESQRRWADVVLKSNFNEREARRLAEQLRARLESLAATPRKTKHETTSKRRYAAPFERGGTERNQRQRRAG